jgi:hypothetical protein
MTTMSLLHRQVSAPEKSKTSYEGMWVPCAFESAQSEFILLHTAYSTVRINTLPRRANTNGRELICGTGYCHPYSTA